jgi:hypothetical protein
LHECNFRPPPTAAQQLDVICLEKKLNIIILIFILAWIIAVPTVWLIIRRYRPQWIGLGEDFNEQKIDNVKYHKCPECSTGRMEPKFNPSFFRPVIGIPPGLVYGLGPPKEYVCLNCGMILDGNYFGEKVTKISLVSRVSKKDAVQSIIIFILLMFGVFLMAIYLF